MGGGGQINCRMEKGDRGSIGGLTGVGVKLLRLRTAHHAVKSSSKNSFGESHT